MRNKYDFLIIETKCEFYSLVLSDSNDYVNIRSEKISQIKPKKLNFPLGAKVFVQNYNSERVVVSYFDKAVDLYNIFSLDEPMLSYNLSEIYKSKGQSFDIVSIFFYEKLLMILTKDTNIIYTKEDEQTKEICRGGLIIINEKLISILILILILKILTYVYLEHEENIYSIKVLNTGKFQNNELNVFDYSSSENQKEELNVFEIKNKEQETDVLNIVNKLTDESNNKDQFYYAMVYYANKFKTNKGNN